jgi:hypothetical protein
LGEVVIFIGRIGMRRIRAIVAFRGIGAERRYNKSDNIEKESPPKPILIISLIVDDLIRHQTPAGAYKKHKYDWK